MDVDIPRYSTGADLCFILCCRRVLEKINFLRDMKFFLFSAFIVLSSCYNNSTSYTVHTMTVSPTSLTFTHSDNSKTISITHDCTCPFSWNVNVLTSTQVFKDTSGAGDNSQVSISIDRSKLSVDTLHAVLQITSNGYGTDTVQVTVLK